MPRINCLRWFRDNFVSTYDINYYYQIAPIIVEAINEQTNCAVIYQSIYENVIAYCVKLIESGNYKLAYTIYKNSILDLEETYVRPVLNQRLIRALNQQGNKIPL